MSSNNKRESMIGLTKLAGQYSDEAINAADLLKETQGKAGQGPLQDRYERLSQTMALASIAVSLNTLTTLAVDTMHPASSEPTPTDE